MGDCESDFRQLQLQDDVAIYLQSKEYRKALSALSDIKQLLQSDENIVKKFYFKTLESECHLRLEEYSASSLVSQEIDQLLESSNIMPGDVNKMVQTFREKKLYARAYIATYAECKLHVKKSANEVASKIKSAFKDMQTMTTDMAKSNDDKKILAKHMLPAMKKIVDGLVERQDNGSHENVEQQASCYFYVGLCYSQLKDNEQDLAMNEAAIKLMQEKLGEEAEKYNVTGEAYHNEGLAYKILGQRSDATSAFTSAIRAKGKATDYSNDNEKETSIEKSKKELSWYKRFKK